MNSYSRKVFVGMISLGGLLGLYMLYRQMSETPPIELNTQTEFIDTFRQSDIGDVDDRVGKIGNVGLANVRKTKFLHRDENGNVDREFGFEELLHQVQDKWEIRKPYINLLMPDLTCRVTADRGTVQVETAVGKSSPKDATFTGNVVIHVRPKKSSNIYESFIYLNDIAYLSEKSLFTTAGPVRFVSQNTQMLGLGLELIYNDQLDRLELFKITELDSLRFKIPPGSANPFVAPSENTKHPAIAPAGLKQEKKRYYRCVFMKDALVNAPEQLVFAKENLSIDDILWQKSSGGQLSESISTAVGDANSIDIDINDSDSFGELSDELTDVIVTCTGGVLVAPMDSAMAQKDFNQIDAASTLIDGEITMDYNDAAEKALLVAQRIHHIASTGNSMAIGPLEVRFYARNPTGAKQSLVPVRISAEKKAQFIHASNRIILENECLFTMLRDDVNILQKDSLSAPLLTIDLAVVDGTASATDFPRIAHLTADGGLVKLTSIKTREQKLLGGIELQCQRFDYDLEQELLSALGPGIIKLNNSKNAMSVANTNGLDPRKRCYAFLRDFESLKYYVQDNKITADAGPQRTLRIDYIPVIKGGYGPQTIVTSKHIEVSLRQANDGQTELSSLTALGGITYRDKENYFVGSSLFYNHLSPMVTIQGNNTMPCYFNGALVDSIKINLKTGRIKAQIPAAGAL